MEHEVVEHEAVSAMPDQPNIPEQDENPYSSPEHALTEKTRNDREKNARTTRMFCYAGAILIAALVVIRIRTDLKPDGWAGVSDDIPVLVLFAGVAAVVAVIGDIAGKRPN